MKHLNTKTGLSRKMKAIRGAAMVLGAAAVVAMAPTSQALAYQSVQKSYSQGYVYATFKGHGNTMAKAQADAWNGAGCGAVGRNYKEVARWWGNGVTMYNGSWYNAFLVVKCQYVDYVGQI